MAEKIDIRASVDSDAHGNRHLSIGIIENSVTELELKQALIPHRDIVKSSRHQSTNFTPQQAWDIADNYNYGFNLLIPITLIL